MFLKIQDLRSLLNSGKEFYWSARHVKQQRLKRRAENNMSYADSLPETNLAPKKWAIPKGKDRLPTTILSGLR